MVAEANKKSPLTVLCHSSVATDAKEGAPMQVEGKIDGVFMAQLKSCSVVK
jgi:hypothetical protein